MKVSGACLCCSQQMTGQSDGVPRMVLDDMFSGSNLVECYLVVDDSGSRHDVPTWGAVVEVAA